MASPPSGGGGSGGGGGGELFDLMSPNPHEEAESHARHGHCACHGGGVDEVMPSYVFQPIRAAAPAAAAPASAASLRGSLDSMAASSNLKVIYLATSPPMTLLIDLFLTRELSK